MRSMLRCVRCCYHSTDHSDLRSCYRCDRCIIRMDHHCPIIGRCIHMHNHKYFLLFLFWAAVLCGYAVFVTAPALFRRTSAVIWSFTGKSKYIHPDYYSVLFFIRVNLRSDSVYRSKSNNNPQQFYIMKGFNLI